MISRYNDKTRVLKIEKKPKLISDYIISKHSSAPLAEDFKRKLTSLVRAYLENGVLQVDELR